ncbi:hypothetical protein SCFA_180002 [anaerobic digester metagenome]|uniref:Uncharacterized protein n=1 Tax=anaerobic digester metagenome TaxID=1263854 RepID=A0A485M1L4_9ZZZZ
MERSLLDGRRAISPATFLTATAGTWPGNCPTPDAAKILEIYLKTYSLFLRIPLVQTGPICNKDNSA